MEDNSQVSWHPAPYSHSHLRNQYAAGYELHVPGRGGAGKSALLVQAELGQPFIGLPGFNCSGPDCHVFAFRTLQKAEKSVKKQPHTVAAFLYESVL